VEKDSLSMNLTVNSWAGVPQETSRLKERAKVISLERAIQDGIKKGELINGLPSTVLTHRYAPIVAEYGCGTYARELFMPKGLVVTGKIHKHSHINVISKGKVAVVTEFGKKVYEAPCTFVSEVGLKRAVYIEEDTVWTTIHLTKHIGEDNLDSVEEEVIAKSYTELGLEEPDMSKMVGYNIKELEELV
jgi:hypothetical protein